MIETYTFSRALHLMRYSGKNTGDCFSAVFTPALAFSEIMGSWVEVKK